MNDVSAPSNVIEKLYSSFSRLDHAGMAECYADHATFSDPVFRNLEGTQVKAMWRMLCERAADLVVSCRDVKIDGDVATAHWEATYTFSATKRKVHNVIEARFTLKDGKIVSHVDSFDLWKWTSMALGLKGMLLGWAPFVQNAVRKQAMTGLELFMKRKRLA